MTSFNEQKYRVFIDHHTPSGWDWLVKVIRLADGKTRTAQVPGQWENASRAAEALIKEFETI